MRNHIDGMARTVGEPRFEVPPRVVAGPERRLTGYAAAALAAGLDARAFRDNAVRLERDADGAARVVAAGRAVAQAFDLMPGLLAGPPDSLAGVLAARFADATDAVTPFEAAVTTAAAACVLLRGVLMPTRTGADVVLSWKQVLDADATARLRAELLRELRPASTRARLVNVFG